MDNQDLPVLKVEQLSVTAVRGGIEVLKNLSFSIEKGETVALLGESGAGKSTLFKTILQVLRIRGWKQSGKVISQGMEIQGLTPFELEKVRGPKIRCIFQEPALSLNPSLKISRQLKEAIETIEPELTGKEVLERMKEALVNSGLDPDMILDKYPGDISGGQRQRVGVAMSICTPTPLLLADEPSNSLDSVTVTELVDTLLRLRNSGYISSLFIVTHDIGILKALDCQRVLYMDQGELFEVGNIQQVLEKPAHPKLAEMISLRNVIESMESQSDEVQDKQVPLYEVANIQFGYRSRSFFSRAKIPILKDVGFEIGKNEFVALVGNSGSGKSTIGKLLTQELKDYQGEILFDGNPMAHYRKGKGKKRFHRDVQIIFQEPADTFDPSLTMRQNLEEGFFAMGLNRDEVEKAFDRLLDKLLLDRRMLDEQPHNLSGGQKQRFALMRAFGSRPSMILADEPFNNLDLIAQQRLIELLLERKQDKERPMSCVLISHDIGVVSKLCERAFVIDDGRIIESGPVDDIVKHSTHPATQRLIQAAAMLGSIQVDAKGV